MAVFPDRIVLKNSTDAEADIITAIQTGGTDAITQGEVVLGIDNTDVKFYTKAGNGSIVILGGTGAGAGGSLASLNDVNLTVAPTDGQGLIYDFAAGEWVAGAFNLVQDVTPQLGADLDVNGFHIVSSNTDDVVIGPDPTGSGNLVVRGNGTSGGITLNCTSNTHGVTIESPPHSDGATYTLTLPSGPGTPGQVLTSQGSGSQLTWGSVAGLSGIDALNDVDTATSPPADGEALVWDNAAGQWVPGTVSGVGAIGDLTNVDTATNPPVVGQTLFWDGTNWVPGDQGGGGGVGSSTVVAAFAFGYINATAAGTGTGVSWGTYDSGTGNIDVTFDTAQADTSYIVVTDNESADDIGASVSNKSTTGFRLSLYSFSTGNPASPAAYPISFQVFTSSGTQQVAGSGGGGGGSTGGKLSDTQTSVNGEATFNGLGHSGTLVSVTSTQAAWIVLYGSAADRTADASRAFDTDPTTSSGVLAEFYVPGNSTVLATPGTSYFNNDTAVTEAIYAAVRTQAGIDVSSAITIVAYGDQTITAVNGGTFGSGV